MTAQAAQGQASARDPLNRQRVLEAALALVDAEGFEALSMRRLGAELGVEAMSIYKHVENREALLAGIVEQLWTEVAAAMPDGGDWASRLRSFAHAVRSTMHRHPGAASLMLSRCVLPLPLLGAYASLLETLREAGFDEATSTRTARSLFGYVLGYVSTELYWLGGCRGAAQKAGRSPADQKRGVDTTQILLWLGRTLPSGTPSHLVEAAVAMLDCDPDDDFDASLDVAVEGLQPQLRQEPTP